MTVLEGKGAQGVLLDFQTTASSKAQIVYSSVQKAEQGWQQTSMGEQRTPHLAQTQDNGRRYTGQIETLPEHAERELEM